MSTPRLRDVLLRRCDELTDEIVQERAATAATAAQVQKQISVQHRLAGFQAATDPISGAESDLHGLCIRRRELLRALGDALSCRLTGDAAGPSVLAGWNTAQRRGGRKTAPSKDVWEKLRKDLPCDNGIRRRAVPTRPEEGKEAHGGRRIVARGQCYDDCALPRGPHVPAGLLPARPSPPRGGDGYPRSRPLLRCRTTSGRSGPTWSHTPPRAPFALAEGDEDTIYLPSGLAGQGSAPQRFGKGVAGCTRGGMPQQPSVASYCAHPAQVDKKRPKHFVSVFDSGTSRTLRDGDGCVERRVASKNRAAAGCARHVPAVVGWTNARRAHDWHEPARGPRPPPTAPPIPTPPTIPARPRARTPIRLRGVQQGRAHGPSGSCNVLPTLLRSVQRPAPPHPTRSYIDYGGDLLLE
eukprot:TRINITY_DN17049_c0_g2_i1.p1 TRINITY_DN17049_c0_g2~~TRINITY_DN17049_c0_g2_i1.p1  ORF type:complete len:410 (+),score=114.83 TRINITY_DN17049_c0_g2_i1:56-1285(+)